MEDQPGHEIAYDGVGEQVLFLSLWLAFLNLITLFIYRFWATTRLRRYFWNHVALDGERFEYMGRGRELFFGFLIATLVLTLGFTPFAIAQELWPKAAWAIGTVKFLALMLLIDIGRFLARRYRLTRSSWRGIRASQRSDVAGYLKLSCAWYLAELATLGLLQPLRRAAQQRYQLDATSFGSLQGSCSLRGTTLLPSWLPVWLFGIAAWILLLAANFGALGQIRADYFPTDQIAGWSVVAAGLCFFLAAFLLLRYRVVEFRALVHSTRLGPLGFSTDLRWGSIMLMILLAALIVLIFPILIALAAWTTSQGFLTLAIIGGVIGFGLIGTVIRAMWRHWMFKNVIRSLAIQGRVDPAELLQSTDSRPSFGEGLAGVVDFAG